MAPTYKLIYFDGAGAAEPIRYIFAYGKQEYEDVRISKEQWPDLKDKTPFGKLPLLEIDGTQIPQSNAIARYLAKKFNLTGKDEWEAFQCDSIVDSLGDFKQVAMKAIFETDEAKAKELKKNLSENEIPFYFKRFEKIIAKNGGFTVGSQITWSDLVFAASFSDFAKKIPAVLKPYPAIQGLVTKINSLPSIKAWLDRRPVGTF